MSIKVKFVIIGAVVLITAVIANLFLFQDSDSIGKELEKQWITSEIKNKIFERTILRDNYLLYREERPLAQLEETKKDLDILLTQASIMFASTNEQIAIGKIFSNKKFIDEALSQIIANPSPGLEQQLIIQILIKSQDNITIASQLENASRNNVTRNQQKTKFLILSLVLGESLIILIALYFIWRSIGEPLLALKKAAARISTLDFSATADAGKGELGELGRVFNTMAKKLKESYASLKNAKIAAQNVYEDLLVGKEGLTLAKVKDEALLASIGDGIIATGPDRRIIVMNKMAEKLLGWKIDEAIGKLYDDIVLLEDEKGTFVSPEEKPLHKAFAHGTVTTTSTTTGLYLLSKNKIKFPVAITVSPIILDNKIIGAVEVFRDITEQKKVEKLRADFLSLASHQLRTPLSGTKWLIETMQKKILGKVTRKQKTYLSQIYKLNERMIQLVSEMLGVLRLESETGPANKEAVLISDLYKDISISMSPAAKSKKIIFHNNLAEHKNVAIETNRELLKSILECFISNAINYSKPGQEVSLDAKEETSAVVFLVEDNGIGIPEEEQKQIFGKFYRASNAKEFKPGGSGLGLNIAKMLSEKIGAVISFESKENKGATFYLRIPNQVV